jgi:hypothetical protein
MNRRILLAFLVAAVSVAAVADPIKYTVRLKGEKVGTYVDETTGDDDSGYVDDSTLTMTHEGQSATIHEISRYGKDGIDLSKIVEVTQEGHNLKVKAVLGDDGAKVSIWDDDQKDEQEVPLADKTPRADATNFWWKNSKPSSGDSVTYQSFDMEEMKWTKVTLKFVGRSKIKIGDQELDANEVDRTQIEVDHPEAQETSKVYVDDKGDPLVIEEGEMRIERDLG